MKLYLFIVLVTAVTVLALPRTPSGNDKLHRYNSHKKPEKIDPDELGQTFWFNKGQNILKQNLAKKLNTNIAKNIIFFLGDGMSIPTVTSARILQGQMRGENGEENNLFFDTFPVTGLSHTYCVDAQVADSACSATAYLCGVKTNDANIGVTAAVNHKNCTAMSDSNNHVYSIGKWAQDAGKATGVVTTTDIADASPAGVYAHTADRDWQDDTAVIIDGADVKLCPDIAQQLITGETGKNLNVIMGGGLEHFLATRVDRVNLTQVWEDSKRKNNQSFVYVNSRSALQALGEPTEFLLGLFADSHFHYHLENATDEPTLEEMTERAIRNLQQFPNGYFLFVEGGMIDKGHHANRARRALDEVDQFDRAIKKAVDMTDDSDTLIIVTADHAHTVSLNGYADRGYDVLGIAGNGDDNLPYTTLTYSNGPGYQPGDSDGNRHDITGENLADIKYRYPAAVPRDSETHGGDDVGVFARGPWSHLFTGSYEQNFIPYALAYAACIGDGLRACDDM